MNLPTEQEVFSILTLIYAVFILIALMKPAWFKFLLDKDSLYPSLQRQGQYVAMVTMTWGFMWQVSKGQLSDWYAGTYLFVLTGSQALSIFLKQRGADQHEHEHDKESKK